MLVTANHETQAYLILSEGKPCAEIYFSLNRLSGVMTCLAAFADLWDERVPTATTIETSAQLSDNVENELLLRVLRQSFPDCTGRNISKTVVEKFEKLISSLEPDDKSHGGARKASWTLLMQAARLHPVRLGGIA